MNPLVSVVMGSYNRKSFLRRAINSVRASEVDFGYEIIVVDGGSTDGSIKWLVQQKDITTIIQHNRGTWKGHPIGRKSWGYFMNLAFKCAQGQYVLMLSDDSLVHPEATANGVAFLEKRLAEGKKVGAVPFYFRNWPKDGRYFVLTVKNQVYLNHGLYLKSALEEVNYVNENDYMFYCADVDLCLRLVQEGYSIEATDSALVEHYNHANWRVRRSNKAVHEQDQLAFATNWSEFLEGKRGIEVGSLIESPRIPDDCFARSNFGTLHRWYKLTIFLGIPFLRIYNYVENRFLLNNMKDDFAVRGKGE